MVRSAFELAVGQYEYGVYTAYHGGVHFADGVYGVAEPGEAEAVVV
jgi:hypothetical protein